MSKRLFRHFWTVFWHYYCKEASSTSKEWLIEVLKNDLIVLDEIGYLPIDPRYTHLFFQFINECYEYRSVLISSNTMPAQWRSYFGDESVAMAILDRLMHHSEIVIMNGDSYRLKDKLETLKASEKFCDGAFPLRSKAPSQNFNWDGEWCTLKCQNWCILKFRWQGKTNSLSGKGL